MSEQHSEAMIPLPIDKSLPLVVMDCIIQHAVREADKPTDILLVNKGFFPVAARVLYHSPVIITRPDSFFEHGGRVPPPGFRNMTTSDLVERGYFKYAALRAVRSVSIVDPATLTSFDRYSSYIFPSYATYPLSSAATMATMLRSRRLNEPLYQLYRCPDAIPSGVMPNLSTVRIVASDCASGWSRDAYQSQRTGLVIELYNKLLKRTQAQSWYWSGQVRRPPFVPPVLHLHEDFARSAPYKFSLRIIPGGTTFIHLHSTDLGVSGSLTTEELSMAFRMLGFSIGNSFISHNYYDPSPTEQRARMDRTRITINAPLPSLATSSTACEVRREMQGALIRGMIEDSACRDEEMYLRVGVEVRLGPEGDACQVCLGCV